MPIYALGDIVPQVDPTAFVHPDAVLIGEEPRLAPHRDEMRFLVDGVDRTNARTGTVPWPAQCWCAARSMSRSPPT